MTRSAGPVLEDLYREYGHQIRFVTLYVREAHPGERVRQPRTMAQKVRAAQGYADRDGIPWPVLVDDLDGTLHRQLEPHPHSAYFVDATGRVAHRALWANDEGAMRRGLDTLLRRRLPPRGQQNNRIVPMLRGLGSMYETLALAGEEAKADVRRQAPPVYALARLAGAFRRLPPLGRTLAAAGAVTLVASLGVWGLSRLRSAPA